MALKKKTEKEKKQVAYDVEVLKAIQCKNDSIMLNLLVNGVYINGAFYKTVEAKKGKHAGEEIGIIQFPQRKGEKDGKDAWFDVCSFFVDEETLEDIEKQIEDKLDD